MFLLNRKFIVIGAIAILIGISMLFRIRIGALLDFGRNAPAQVVAQNTNPTAVTSPVGKPIPVPASQPKTPKLPVYQGRDPGEVRPVPEEIKLFTDDQKQRIYHNIQASAAAVKNDPTYFDGWMEIGLLKKDIGDFIGARDAWDYAGEIEPLNSISFANVGDLYWRYLHEYAKAEENLKTSIKNKPNDPTTYITLADLYHYSYAAKHNLAPQVLLDGLKANPDDQSIMRHLAYIYELRKEYGKALEWWQQVLALAPGDQDVMARINDVKQKISGGTTQ